MWKHTTPARRTFRGWKTLNTLVLEDIRRNARWAKIAERDYAQLLINAKQAQ